jgi:hypothetical protein
MKGMMLINVVFAFARILSPYLSVVLPDDVLGRVDRLADDTL